MAPFVHRFVHRWRENRDILFAVSALSDGLFNSEEDIRAYTEVIEDYFADSETEAETDNECG